MTKLMKYFIIPFAWLINFPYGIKSKSKMEVN
jgi:hypothetical protein